MVVMEAQYGICAVPGKDYDVYMSLKHKGDAGIKSVVPYSAGFTIKVAVSAIDQKGLDTLEKTLKEDPRIAIVKRLDNCKPEEKQKVTKNG
jgi:hypothetical protein